MKQMKPKSYINYNISNQKSQDQFLEISKLTPPYKPSVNQRAQPETNLLSHAPNRCEVPAETFGVFKNLVPDLVEPDPGVGVPNLDNKEISRHVSDEKKGGGKGGCLKSEISVKREQCGKSSIKLQCRDCGNVFWVYSRCRLRTCRKCAKEFADKIFFSFKEFIKNLPYRKGYSLKLITFTTVRKEGDDLKGTVDLILKAFRKIWHTHLEQEDAGAIVALEFGEKNMMVHLHVFYYGGYLKVEEIRKRWRELTGASSVSLDCVDVKYICVVCGCEFETKRKIKKHFEEKHLGEKPKWRMRYLKGKELKEKREKALREITKYIVKIMGKRNKERLNQIELALRGVRRFVTYGIFYNRARIMKVMMKRKTICERCGSSNLKFLEIEEVTPFIRQQIFARNIFLKEKFYDTS